MPLTLDDVLHPEEGDFIVRSKAHTELCVYLRNVLGSCTAGDPTAVVLRDVRIEWDQAELRANGPDIAVITGVEVESEVSASYASTAPLLHFIVRPLVST